MHGTFIEIMLPLCLGVLIWFGWMLILVVSVSITQKVVKKGRAHFFVAKGDTADCGLVRGPRVEYKKCYP